MVNLNDLKAVAYIAAKFDVTVKAVRLAAQRAETNDRNAIYLMLRNYSSNPLDSLY